MIVLLLCVLHAPCYVLLVLGMYMYRMSLAVRCTGFFLKGKVEPKKVSINTRYICMLMQYHDTLYEATMSCIYVTARQY